MKTTLPIMPPGVPPSDPKPILPVRLLVMADEPADGEQDILTAGAAAGEFIVRRVRTVAELREQISGFQPDLILADVGRFDPEVPATSPRLRELAPNAGIILIFDSPPDGQILDTLRAGATGWIARNRPEQLRPTVRRVLEELETCRQAGIANNRLALLARAVEQSPVSVVITDSAGDIEYVNPRFTTFTGYSSTEVIGRNPRLLKSGETPPQTYRELWETITSGGEWHGRFHNRKKGGDLYWEDTIISPITDTEGRITHFLGVKEDITALLLAAESVARVEARYRRLFESSRDAIMTGAPPEWRFTSANPATLSLFGVATEQEFVTLAPWDLSPERQPDGELSATKAKGRIEQALKDGSAFFEWTHQKRTGETFPATVLLTRVELDGVLGMQATVRDVSEQKRAERELEEQTIERKKLEAQFLQAQKMDAVGQLAGGVAHDFNNILTVILGQAELASTELAPDVPAIECVNEIAEAAQRAAALTRQLLTFSRKQPVQLARLQLSGIVASMSRMISRILGEDIELVIDSNPGLPSIMADAGMMEQIILNLAVNARDAMPEGGRLAIRTSVETIGEEYLARHPEAVPGPYICLEVIDNGCGMMPEIQARIFEPFFTTKPQGKGTGLGLATVFGIARQHQGWVHVYSELNHGTTFRIFLPVPTKGQEALTKADETAAAPASMTGGTETILLVEDEEAVRKLIRKTLVTAGYSVLEANSGPAALKVWEPHAGEIDLLITDMTMPEGMTGLQLAEILKADRPGLKVLVTSGYSENVISHDFTERTGFEFIRKPFNARQLIEAVRHNLDIREAARPPVAAGSPTP